jgi:hypothetical protein
MRRHVLQQGAAQVLAWERVRDRQDELVCLLQDRPGAGVVHRLMTGSPLRAASFLLRSGSHQTAPGRWGRR